MPEKHRKIEYTLSSLLLPIWRPRPRERDLSKPEMPFCGLGLMKRGYWYQWHPSNGAAEWSVLLSNLVNTYWPVGGAGENGAHKKSTFWAEKEMKEYFPLSTSEEKSGHLENIYLLWAVLQYLLMHDVKDCLMYLIKSQDIWPSSAAERWRTKDTDGEGADLTLDWQETSKDQKKRCNLAKIFSATSLKHRTLPNSFSSSLPTG